MRICTSTPMARLCVALYLDSEVKPGVNRIGEHREITCLHYSCILDKTKKLNICLVSRVRAGNGARGQVTPPPQAV